MDGVKENIQAVDDILAHYGVKGMRWGIRKEEETSGRKISQIKPTFIKLNKQTQVKINEHSKLLVDKFESIDHKLTPEQKKKIAYTIAGTVVVAGVVGGAYYLNKRRNVNPYAVLEKGKLNPVELHQKMLKDKYLVSMNHLAKNESQWYNLTEESFRRPAFEIPAGTTFHRLSNSKETSWGNITYASSSKDDFNRYMAWFGNQLPYHVTFKSNKVLKVPNLDTVLDTLQETTGSTRSEAGRLYSQLSGRKWDTPEGVKLLQSLKAKGFGAIVDENDAGLISSRPLVIFDHLGMGEKANKNMSWGEIESFIMAAKDFSGRK